MISSGGHRLPGARLVADGGPGTLLPGLGVSGWATLDLHYFTIYLKSSVFKSRPRSERWELSLAAAFAVAVVGTVVTLGWGSQYLLLFFLPTRVAITFLAFSFDFLPHYPHTVKASDDPYQATANRVGLEWLLSPLLPFSELPPGPPSVPDGSFLSLPPGMARQGALSPR